MNRLDRIIKWKAYLQNLYSNFSTSTVTVKSEEGERIGANKIINISTMHPLIFSIGVEHDPVKMVFSSVGRCVIFNLCDPL